MAPVTRSHFIKQDISTGKLTCNVVNLLTRRQHFYLALIYLLIILYRIIRALKFIYILFVKYSYLSMWKINSIVVSCENRA